MEVQAAVRNLDHSFGNLGPEPDNRRDSSAAGGRPSKGQSQKERAEQKQLNTQGMPHMNRYGREMMGHPFKIFNCGDNCIRDCKRLSLNMRTQIYADFYGLPHEAQQQFLADHCTPLLSKENKRRMQHNMPLVDGKRTEREYILGGVRVCCMVFHYTLGITPGKTQYLLKKVLTPQGIISHHERRGRHHNNRTKPEHLNFMHEVINKLPRYCSHFTVRQQTRYLHPNLNKRKIYDIYVHRIGKEHPEWKPVSDETFRKFFNLHYPHLKIHVQRKDTCNYCEKIKIQLNMHQGQPRVIAKLKLKWRAHLAKWDSCTKKMKRLARQAGEDENKLCFCFDMMKVSPVPKVEYNMVYYLRQPWLYTTGVHKMVYNQNNKPVGDDRAHLYSWLEGQAKRGANEIGNVLTDFVDGEFHRNPNIDEINSSSDRCPGQNDNHFLLQLMAMLANKYRVQWTHTFLESGHSYMDCDTDFGHVSISAKNKMMYSHDDWLKIMANSQKGVKMTFWERDHFKDIKVNKKFIINKIQFFLQLSSFNDS